MQMYFVVFYIGIKILFGFRYGRETKEFIFVWRLLRVEI